MEMAYNTGFNINAMFELVIQSPEVRRGGNAHSNRRQTWAGSGRIKNFSSESNENKHCDTTTSSHDMTTNKVTSTYIDIIDPP